MFEWRKNLKEATLQMVSSASVAMFGIIVWDNSRARILDCLLREKVVSKEEIAVALDKRIRCSGRASFSEHRNGTPPDHTRSPEAFAYALSRGEFTTGEEGRIRFDHGENKEAFIKLYCGDAADFLSRMVERIFTEELFPPPTEGKGSNADWCSDGPCCCDSH